MKEPKQPDYVRKIVTRRAPVFTVSRFDYESLGEIRDVIDELIENHGEDAIMEINFQSEEPGESDIIIKTTSQETDAEYERRIQYEEKAWGAYMDENRLSKVSQLKNLSRKVGDLRTELGPLYPWEMA